MPESCNLDRSGRRHRLAGGIVALVLAVVLAAWMAVTGASRMWLLALWGLIWSGALGVLQARGHT